MNLRLLCAFLVTAVLQVVADSDDSPVAIRMKAIARDFKTLSGQVSDAAQKDGSIELIGGIRKNIAEAKTQKSGPASERSGAQLEEYQKRFNEGLAALDDRFGKLSEAVKAGDSTRIKALVAEINTLKKNYHKELR